MESQTDKDMKRVRQAKWLEADSHWYGEADKYFDKKTDRDMERQTDKEMEHQTDKNTEKYVDRERYEERQTNKKYKK